MGESNLGERLGLMARDSGLGPEVLGGFERWLRGAPDEELFRVNVIDWSRRHEVPEPVALDLFLHATAAGIFELSWGAICPVCGMLINTPGGLRALGPNPHCNLCRADFPAAADDQVEVTFTLEPAIRALRFHQNQGVDLVGDANKLFFGGTRQPAEGSPSLVHLIQTARGVGVQGECELGLDLTPGVGALIVPDVHAVAFVMVEEGGPEEVLFEVRDGALLPAQARLAPGPSRVRVKNHFNHPLTALYVRLPPMGTEITPTRFKVEQFLSGKQMLTCQTFRDLFRTETIGAQGLSIKRLTVLFSDLQGSTALYQRVGDLRALDLVRRHFEAVTGVLRAHGGTVVKTIGDAVMGAFSEPEPAVAAAIEMSRAVARIDADGQALAVKIGLHSGPCVAIQTNHQIDYFGSAVNTAARVQGVARGGEIVLSEDVWNAPKVADRCAASGLVATHETASLRGLSEPVRLLRLR